MNLRFLKFIVLLIGAVILFGCSSGTIPSTSISLPATSTSVPVIPTISPTTTVVPLPTIAFLPTVSLGTVDPSASLLPTFSFSTAIPTINMPPIATSTISGESPFEFVATLDEILPSTDGRGYFRTASDGSMLLITNQGMARLSDSGWKVYLSNYSGYFVGIDSLGRAWFINQNMDSITPPAGGGATHPPLDTISAWDGTKWTKYSDKDGWASFYRDAFGPSMAELHGQIWVSTQLDLRVFDGSRWKVIKPEGIGLQSPVSLVVNSFPGADEIWVMGCYFNTPQPHGSDIVWYDGSTWQRKAMPEEGGCLSTMPTEHQGHVWMAMRDSLWGFDRATKEWTHYALTQPPSTHIISLAFNESGEPWFISLICISQQGCIGSTLYHLHNEIWIPISPSNPDIRFVSLLTDSTDQVWVWATDGVYQIVNNQPQLVSHLIVSSWAMDRSGKIWAIGRDPSVDNRFSLWNTNP